MKDQIETRPRPARLIPSYSDSEQKVTSILLACFRIVPDFAKEVLQEAGASISKSAEINCYTEIVFKKRANPNKKSRPDGLIFVKSRNKVWTAIVESKVGNNCLTQEQIEEYLDIAKINNVNALITISNQYATIPSHNPVEVSNKKLKSTDLFHFSWLSLETKANLLLTNKVVSDPEQAIILTEFIQFLKDPKSGVTSFSQMGRGWREVSLGINKGIKLKKNDVNVEDAISSWQQFSKFLSINLSEEVGQPVNEYISRSRSKDYRVNYQANLVDIIDKNYLDVEFDIPNAASKLHVIADFNRRTIIIEMSLEAPKDRTYPQSSINWITRQLKDLTDKNIEIRANWPRGICEMKKLASAFEDPLVLVPEGIKDLPRTLDVVQIIDLAGKFSSSKAFVELTNKAVLDYYRNIGQNLRKWVPKPLKSKKRNKNKEKDNQNEQNTNPFWLPPGIGSN